MALSHCGWSNWVYCKPLCCNGVFTKGNVVVSYTPHTVALQHLGLFDLRNHMYNLKLEGEVESRLIWPIPEVGMASLRNTPDLIFSLRTVTNWSRSGRLCSCHLPRAWNSSCMTTPLDSHPPPMEMFCLPPIRPMLEEHLRRGGEGRRGEERGGEGRRWREDSTSACTISCREQCGSPIPWVEYDIITIQELFLAEVNTCASSELINGVCYGRLGLHACKTNSLMST